MAALTLAEAARQVGLSRATIYRAVKDGRLSVTMRHDGQRVVDTSELLRAFGRLTPGSPTPLPETASPPAVRHRETVSRDSARQAPPAIRYLTEDERRREVEIADREALRAELDAARDTIRRLEDQAREAREREVKLMELAQSATRLLEHREAPAAPPRGFLRRLFGR